MPYHWLDFTPPQPQIAAAPVEDFVTAASTPMKSSTSAVKRPALRMAAKASAPWMAGCWGCLSKGQAASGP